MAKAIRFYINYLKEHIDEKGNLYWTREKVNNQNSSKIGDNSEVKE